MIGNSVYVRKIPKYHLELMNQLAELSSLGELRTTNNNTVIIKTGIQAITFVFDEYIRMRDYIKWKEEESRLVKIELLDATTKYHILKDAVNNYMNAHKNLVENKNLLIELLVSSK